MCSLAVKKLNNRRICAVNNLFIYRKIVLAMTKYIYQYKNWTDFSWQDKAINVVFGEVRHMQGKIMGQMNALGFSAKEEAIAQ
jgi:hypothetical protein